MENQEEIKRINGLIIASLIINLLIALSSAFNPDYPAFLPVLMFTIWAVGLIGAIMSISTGSKASLIMIVISCALFVPIGLIGVFGARKILDSRKRLEADA